MQRGRPNSHMQTLTVRSSGLLRKKTGRFSMLEHDKIGSETSDCWSTRKFFSGSLTQWAVRAILIDSMSVSKNTEIIPTWFNHNCFWSEDERLYRCRCRCRATRRREGGGIHMLWIFPMNLFPFYAIELWTYPDCWFIMWFADRTKEDKAENLVSRSIILNPISTLTLSVLGVAWWETVEFGEILFEPFHSNLCLDMGRWSCIFTF